MTPNDTIAVAPDFAFSKSAAQKILRRQFINAQLRTTTTADDKAKGHERWQVLALGKAGRVGLVEVAGPVGGLPKASVIAAYRLVNVEVTFGRDDKGRRSLKFEPVKKHHVLKAENGAVKAEDPTGSPQPSSSATER